MNSINSRLFVPFSGAFGEVASGEFQWLFHCMDSRQGKYQSSNCFLFHVKKKKGKREARLNQEPMYSSMQLHYIPVSAFS